MGYYWTLVSDLPHEEIIVRQPNTLSKTTTVANGQSCTPLTENSAVINDINGHHTIMEKKDQ